MYLKEDINYGVASTLIYGAQWDTALNFIGAYYIEEAGYDTYATDSTGMENYSETEGENQDLKFVIKNENYPLAIFIQI